MAQILPDNPPRHMPAEVLRAFKALKALPEDYYVWHHLAPWQPDAPDFLLITPGSRALLVKVCPASAVQATPAAQMLLLDDARRPVGEVEEEIVLHFIQSLDLPLDHCLSNLILFPNIPHRQVLYSRPTDSNGGMFWAGKELLQENGHLRWEDYLPEHPLDPLQLEKLRQAFTPEVVVPKGMTVRLPVERRVQAGLTDYLMDYSQESAVKADLDLEPDGESLSGDFRLNIINGVAGSGKTLILLYRLRLLYHLYPQKRFLVLTHNRPLINDMQSRFFRLEGKLPVNIEWYTFMSWCKQRWPKQPAWTDPLSVKARQRVLQPVWQQHLRGTPISLRMLTGEIDWIKDQLPMTQAEYLQADRRGRGFRLSQEQRERAWQAVEAYQQALDEQGRLDWGEVPRRLWQYEQAGAVQFPDYDVLLVDEAQFFAPLWFAILQKLLKQQNAHLFVVADPTQGFLGRGASWKSLGLQARGRSQQLRRSYRTTREILQFASLFYRLRLPEEQEEEVLVPDLLNMPNGAFPEMLSLTSPQDEISRVANEVESFVRQGYPRSDLLILHANGSGVRRLKTAVDGRLGKDAAMDPKDNAPNNYVRVTTLNAGAGLEAPVVFLVGLRELFEEEQSLRMSDEERVVLIRDNTRKIYMAATRAGQRLVFTYVGDLPEVLSKVRAHSQKINSG